MDNCKNSRLDYFDVVKFLTIFLVIWGHVVQQSCMLHNPFEDYVYQTIYTFHMPLFMGLCGFFFYKSIDKCCNIDDYITHKFKQRIVSLVLPMLSFGLLKMLLSGNYSLMNYFLQVKGIWFLGALALNTIIIVSFLKYGIDETCKLKYSTVFVSIIPVAFLAALYKGFGVFMFIFFLIGFLLPRCRTSIKKNKLMLLIAVIIFIGFDFIYNVLPYEIGNFRINIFKFTLQELLLVNVTKTVLGFCGSFIFLSAVYNMFPYIKNSRLYQYAVSRGERTLDIYLLNIVVLEIILGTAYRKLVSIYHVNFFYEYGFLWEVLSTFMVAVLVTELLFQIGQAMRKSAYIRAIFFAAK